MSAKKEKKLRKLYRRGFSAAAVKAADEAVARLAEEQRSNLATLIKPRPRWMPAFLYQWAFKTIIK